MIQPTRRLVLALAAGFPLALLPALVGAAAVAAVGGGAAARPWPRPLARTRRWPCGRAALRAVRGDPRHALHRRARRGPLRIQAPAGARATRGRGAVRPRRDARAAADGARAGRRRRRRPRSRCRSSRAGAARRACARPGCAGPARSACCRSSSGGRWAGGVAGRPERARRAPGGAALHRAPASSSSGSKVQSAPRRRLGVRLAARVRAGPRPARDRLEGVGAPPQAPAARAPRRAQPPGGAGDRHRPPDERAAGGHPAARPRDQRGAPARLRRRSRPATASASIAFDERVRLFTEPQQRPRRLPAPAAAHGGARSTRGPRRTSRSAWSSWTGGSSGAAWWSC